jgi:hypothetical protein
MIFQLLKGMAAAWAAYCIFGPASYVFSPMWMWVLGLLCVVCIPQSFFTFFRKLRETQEGNFMGWLI